MKTAKVAIVLSLMFLLVGSSPVFAEDSHHDSQPNLSLTLTGGILDSGTQHYSHSGGELAAAIVGGVPIDTSSAHLEYSLDAVITGLAVQGQATFSLSYLDSTGAHVQIDGSAPIGDMMPAEFFPFTCTNPDGTPTPSCTSGIPGMFIGMATINTQTCQGDSQSEGDGQSQGQGDQSTYVSDNSDDEGDSNNCQTSPPANLSMVFESAFLNPFGGPIFMAPIAPGDESLVIVASYDRARVTWDGIQMGGSIVGTLSGTPVAGMFSQVVSAAEDLKAGHESERGTITFAQMSNPLLNADGRFSGESTIPQGSDCSSLPGFLPGTCQITGFHSDGHFSQKNALGNRIRGDYSVEWTAPAVAFTSTVTANLGSGSGE
ncbi:MAG TPA: hypothetical protein VGR53_06370 [Nitrososphaerales archaeon]|nr:hypothetical protein [Nitrososphaerales archaeon]